MTAARIVSLVLVLILTVFVDLGAQEPSLLFLRAKVRGVAPSIVDQRVVGVVVALNNETLVVSEAASGTHLDLPLASVTKLDVIISHFETGRDYDKNSA